MKLKKILSSLLAAIMIFSCIYFTQISVSAATQNDAINWVRSNLNKTLGNGQCVALIKSYYQYLGVSPVSGNGCDYSWNALPSGWQRVKGGMPQKGDILVYSATTDSPYGHVAIYESDYSVYHQNYSKKKYVIQVTNVKYNERWLSNYWGYIRPNFSGNSSAAPSTPASPSVSFKAWSNGNYTFIGETNAAIGQEITVSNGTCTETGMYLYDNSEKHLATGKNSSYTLARVFFNVNKEMGYTLKPGTTYKYKFYAVVNGKTYWSGMQSFKTSGNAVVEPTVKFNTWSNNKYTFIAETNAAIGQEILVSNGTCTETGMYLYDNSDKHIASGKNTTYTLARVFFNVNKEMGYTLVQGTKYQYKFYAVVNGKTYWSGMQSFQTSGTAPSAHTHNYNQKNTDGKYLKANATCTSADEYYYSCSCGEKGNDTFTSGNALGHDYKETVYDTYKEYKCSRCGNSYEEDIEAPAPTPQPKTYTLTYNANGGSNAPSSQTQTENGKLIVSSDTPTRNGYNFLGWALNKSAVVPAYYGGNSVVMIDDTTLYAVWEEIEENYYEEDNNYIMEFWLFYDANGGVGAPAPVTKEEGTRITITSKEPTRTGYTFLGWSESAYSTDADYMSGDRLTLDHNTTLYGVWKKDNDSYWNGKAAPSDWAVEEVEQAIACGLVPEKLQKNFTMPVYRLEVAGMFINLIEGMTGKDIDDILSLEGVSRNQSAFTDTKDSDVLAANALGIINGVGNKTFDCYGTLTRGEIAAILNRTAKLMGIKTTGYSHNFTDCGNHWCSSELGYPTHAGIITGVGNNKFAPDEKLTTEQAIAIVYRAFQGLY